MLNSAENEDADNRVIPGNKSLRENITCWYCRKLGHYKFECEKRIRDKRKQIVNTSVLEVVNVNVVEVVGPENNLTNECYYVAKEKIGNKTLGTQFHGEHENGDWNKKCHAKRYITKIFFHIF